jgi:adenine/guanine phosphoribosyltransferase-like PRPP-binding protein
LSPDLSTEKEVCKMNPKLDDDFIGIWKQLNGYYECPRGPGGECHGPLVGYAGRYHTPEGERQYVGHGYYNFAKIEEYPDPDVLEHFATSLADQIVTRFGARTVDTVCMMTMGGVMLGCDVGRLLRCQRVFPDKKTLEAATLTSREVTTLVMARHQVKPGSRVLILEDVCNNFSTTEQACSALKERGTTVIGIACALNRSPAETFQSATFGELPVVSLIFKPTPEYRQDDAEVAQEIAEGNVVWKPKEDWEALQTAMRNYEQRSSGTSTCSS